MQYEFKPTGSPSNFKDFEHRPVDNMDWEIEPSAKNRLTSKE